MFTILSVLGSVIVILAIELRDSRAKMRHYRAIVENLDREAQYYYDLARKLDSQRRMATAAYNIEKLVSS